MVFNVTSHYPYEYCLICNFANITISITFFFIVQNIRLNIYYHNTLIFIIWIMTIEKIINEISTILIDWKLIKLKWNEVKFVF
jgi:hypothetical protein